MGNETEYKTLIANGVTDCPQLMELIEKTGFMPLLESGIPGFSADEAVAPECRYVVSDEGWSWPLWDWKGPMVTEGGFAYGKFFSGKAGFVSRRWWPELCNWRRSRHPMPESDSVEGIILEILRTGGSMITRDLRAACGFNGKGMRSKFDAYVARLQEATYVVTEDFVYPKDKHGNRYGWGWALLTVPETLFGREACTSQRLPEDSRLLMFNHLKDLLPDASPRQIARLVDGR